MLLDSDAWIELFLGTEKGKKVKELLEKGKHYISIVSIAEITEWSLKNKIETKNLIDVIKKISEVINLNEEIVELAGKINFERKKIIKDWGMLDSLIYATALLYNLKILTGDKHFEKLNNVEML